MHFTLAILLLVAPPLAGQSRQVIDNERVRVLVVSGAAQNNSIAREDSKNRVVIYLNALGGEGGMADSHAGEVRWIPARDSHAGEGVTRAPDSAVEVELKSQGGPFHLPALDPVTLAPRVYRVVLDNPQVRVLRVRIPPKLKVPMHEHGSDRVIVYLTDAHIRAVSDTGKAAESMTGAGEVRWALKGRHSEENLENRPVEVIVVEPK